MLIDSRVNYSSDPTYLRELVKKSGLTQRESARRIGIGFSTLRTYLDGTGKVTYPVLVCLRLLSGENK